LPSLQEDLERNRAARHTERSCCLNPQAETCACGTSDWHEQLIGYRWCQRCGALEKLKGNWSIPLDRAGDVAASLNPPDHPSEAPTRPDHLRALQVLKKDTE
jgi:hypothetical protein